MGIESHQDLLVWQKAMDLVVEVYSLAKLLPMEEKYALSDQMRRAAVSIPSNIAEGKARASLKDYLRFLSIASGSNAELQTQILLCERLRFLSPDQTRYILFLSIEIGKMLSKLKSSLTPNT